MPHLDFRQAFASRLDDAPTVVEPTPVVSNSAQSAALRQRRILATRLPRLQRSDRTTILFAILIFVGGLFCAFYFFNGAEILRAAAAWSREFLYPRPSSVVANDKIDNSKTDDRAAQALSEETKSSNPARTSTSPFSRNVGSLNPSPLGSSAGGGSSSVTLPSGPGSLLSQLNLPPTAGGTLAQTFDHAVADIARVSSIYASAPKKIVQVPVMVSQKVTAQTKKIAQTAKTAGAQANAIRQNVPSARNPASTSADPRQLQDVTTVIGGRGLQRLGAQGLGGGSSSGGLGPGGGAAAGVGGMAGGLGGAVGGAVGGLGGGK
jgi:hypothetical protein